MSVLIIGVDVSKNKLDVCIKLANEKNPIDLGEFPNTPTGFKQIKEKVVRNSVEQSTIIEIVLEPSGGYELPLARFALKAGWQVYMPNPYKVRKWAQGTTGRAKTDKLDARVLARYGANEELKQWKPLPEHLQHLDELLKRQDDLKESLNREKNRLGILQSQGIKSGIALESLKRSIQWLQEELQRLEDELKRFMNNHPDLKEQCEKLKTIPGVGPRNALFLLVLLHHWQLLNNGNGSYKGLVAYVGLDPVPYNSGTSVHRRAGISRMGDPKIRSSLYMGAMASIRSNNPLGSFYKRLVGRGKQKKVALVASTRKILVWSLAIFKKDCVFDPTFALPN